MDLSSYLILGNVISGVALFVTCIGCGLFQRFIHCPYCNRRLYTYALRSHIELCSDHNLLFMGRFRPVIREPLAIPVPLPLEPLQGIKVAEL
jgi:hypothetical protein